MGTIKERLETFLSEKHISKSEFGRAIGVSAAYAGSIRKSIQPDKLAAIAKSYPELNIDWLMTGNGEMTRLAAFSASPPSQNIIKFFKDVDASMSQVELENPSEYDTEDIVLPQFKDCKYAITAFGDSMTPLIHSGEIILLADWQEKFIAYNQIYLVITKSGYRTIKRLRQGNDDAHVLCVSENKDYEPFAVELADISRLYLVKGWICKNEI